MNLGLKALACLLLYPDAALKDNLQEIKEAVAESTLANDQKEALEIFINYITIFSVCPFCRNRNH